MRRRDTLQRHALALLVAVALLAWTGGAEAGKGGGKPGGGGGGDPVPPGTVYATIGGVLHAMDADGSSKVAFPYDPDPQGVKVRGEPSHATHGGHRWFVQMRFLAGTYPSGLGRRELFAVRDDGDAYPIVQLTDDFTLEPGFMGMVDPSGGIARWAPDDGSISWIARRWNGSSVVEAGIYVATIAFDANGNVLGIGGVPTDPVVAGGLTGGPYPESAIGAHDWSPDGDRIVYGEAGTLKIADLSTGGVTTLVTSDVAGGPAWSPDGTTIAYSTGGHASSLATIQTSGAGERILVQGRSGKRWISLGRPAWAPTGDYLLYCAWGEIGIVPPDVYRVSASGGPTTNLTADTDQGARPVAWR